MTMGLTGDQIIDKLGVDFICKNRARGNLGEKKGPSQRPDLYK